MDTLAPQREATTNTGRTNNDTEPPRRFLPGCHASMQACTTLHGADAHGHPANVPLIPPHAPSAPPLATATPAALLSAAVRKKTGSAPGGRSCT
eukprot:scaffold124325_cov36-Phaeocystis_antarctica.AAC.1